MNGTIALFENKACCFTSVVSHALQHTSILPSRSHRYFIKNKKNTKLLTFSIQDQKIGGNFLWDSESFPVEKQHHR